jgi:hypothetical protein
LKPAFKVMIVFAVKVVNDHIFNLLVSSCF